MLEADLELVSPRGSRARLCWRDKRRGDRVRVEVDAIVRARGSGTRLRFQVTDLSTDGCKILVGGYRVNDEVLISLAHLAPLAACVRWVTAEAAGLQFAARLHPSIVEHLRSLYS
jgi:hypothetical protein